MAKRHKGMFKKGGGRVGDRSGHRSKGRGRAKSRTVVVRENITVRTAGGRKGKGHKGHRRHRGSGGGGVTLKHAAIAGLGLAFLAGPATPIAQVKELAEKIPGSKTFGPPAVLGLLALAIDRFVHKNKWLRAAGYVGVVSAALAVGNKGKDFQFVGDPQPMLRGPARRQLEDEDEGAIDFAGDAADEMEGDVEGEEGDVEGDMEGDVEGEEGDVEGDIDD
jgi:hypothetical protein